MNTILLSKDLHKAVKLAAMIEGKTLKEWLNEELWATITTHYPQCLDLLEVAEKSQ